MNNYKSIFRDRSESFAAYMIENRATVRQAASYFCISKSTVHKDLVCRLKYVNPPLYSQVKKLLEINKAERHIRGGEATRKKYKKQTETS